MTEDSLFDEYGTVDMTMLLAALDDLDYENYSDRFPSMDSLKMWYMEDGWEVEEYKEDGYSGLIVKKQGNPIDDIDSTMKKAVIASGSDNSSFIEKQEDKYILDVQVFGEEQRERIADIKKYLKRFDGFLKIVVKLPYKQIESNATSVSEDGKTLEWDLANFDLDQHVHAEFSLENTEKGSGMIWYVVGIIILLGVVLAVILILVNEKKKQQAPNAAYGFPQGAGYPMQNMPGSPNMEYPNPNMTGPQNGGYPNPNMPFHQNGGFQGQFGAPQMPQAGGQNPPPFPNPMPGSNPQGVGYPPQNLYGNSQMQRSTMNDDQRFRPKETMGEIPPQGTDENAAEEKK
uniref:LppM domain-containing protein n=1 Tax=Eubacterium cellulosolvens (strain ATCC 43171 / JCM 9499 / 6) TaxID=633697 RepID=I5AQ46_EUBC6